MYNSFDDDFDDEMPRDASKKAPKKPKAKSSNNGPQVLQLNLGPRDASRLHELHIEAQTTFDDLSMPKSVLLKAGLIALLSMNAKQRADIINQSLVEANR